MKIEKFEDIICWQKAKILTLECYTTLKSNKDYSFKDQIHRACVSIMNNIAEGFERKGNKVFKHFLFIAKGSCGEVRSMFHLGLDLGYINKEKYIDLNQKSIEISRLLSGFIKSL